MKKGTWRACWDSSGYVVVVILAVFAFLLVLGRWPLQLLAMAGLLLALVAVAHLLRRNDRENVLVEHLPPELAKALEVYSGGAAPVMQVGGCVVYQGEDGVALMRVLDFEDCEEPGQKLAVLEPVT